MYWKVSVSLKCLCTSKIDFFLVLVNTYVKESYFGTAFVYVRSSSFGCLKFFPHVVVTVSRTTESALFLVCFTLVLYHDKMLSPTL